MKKSAAHNTLGFTIIELIIAMFISAIVMIGIWNTFSFQQQSYALQRQIVAMEQNLRAGMQFMETEIRMAGCDPNGTADAGILAAGANSIRFNMDINNDANTGIYDGDPNDTNEDVTYSLYTESGIQKLGRISPSTATIQPVAEYIQALSFQYYDADGNITSTLADIRSVVITLTAQTANTSPTRTATLTSKIVCRNLGI